MPNTRTRRARSQTQSRRPRPRRENEQLTEEDTAVADERQSSEDAPELIPEESAKSVAVEEEDVADGAAQPLSTHLIFQCGSCRAILGDTVAAHETHLESETISLQVVQSIRTEDELHMSDSGFDAGCTFKRITCEECEARLGRVYTSTTAALDTRRGTFTFDTAALISYQLGSCRTDDGAPVAARGCIATNARPDSTTAGLEVLDQHVDSLIDVTNKLTSAVDHQHAEIADLREAGSLKHHMLNELKDGLKHAQNMILLWEERFQRLDACEQHVSRTEANCASRMGDLETLASDLQEDWRRFAECEQRIEQVEAECRLSMKHDSQIEQLQQNFQRVKDCEVRSAKCEQRCSQTESEIKSYEERLARIETILTLDRRETRGATEPSLGPSSNASKGIRKIAPSPTTSRVTKRRR